MKLDTIGSIRPLKDRGTVIVRGLVLLAIVACIWWAFEPYQSHYLIGLKILGDNTTQNLWGLAKEGRGDEWSTYIPFLKQASLEGFPKRSSLSPYYENFYWFIAIPKKDLSLFFLPNYLAYFIFSAGKALSFQGLYYNFLAVASLAWYLRNIRVAGWISLAAAISVVFSHFYQVWWTSNFAVLATIFLPFAAFTSNFRLPVKFILIFWSVGHLTFSQLYPPFYIAAAFALVPLTFAIRPDLLKMQTLVIAGLATILALYFYYFTYGDFISAVSNTSYPGKRLMQGGGSSWTAILGSIFPTLPPFVPQGADRVYEMSVVGTMIPLACLSLMPRIKFDKTDIRVTIIVMCTLAALCVYAVVGVPEWLAKYTGLYLVPGRRMQFGISLLVNIYATFLVSKHWNSFSALSFVTVFLSSAVVLTLLNGSEAPDFLWYEYYAFMPLFPLVLYGLVRAFTDFRVDEGEMGRGVLVLMAATHIVVFGSFNPVMKGSSIMAPVETQLVSEWKKLYELNEGEPLAIAGNFGHLLRGEGLPALEAIHLVSVDPSLYESVFPYLDDDVRERHFNRFVGILFENIPSPEARGISVAFPLLQHAVLYPHRTFFSSHRAPGNRLTFDPSKFLIMEAGARRYDVYWSGVLDDGIDLATELRLFLPCPIESSILTRGPIAGTAYSVEGSLLRLFHGLVTISADSAEHAKECASGLGIYLGSDSDTGVDSIEQR